MFMTLKCSRGAEGSIKHVDTSGSFNRPREYYSSLACTTCRSKKLGCSREKSGCRRCLSRGEACVYEPPRHRKKTQKQAMSPPNREATQSPRDSPSATGISQQAISMAPTSPIPRSVPGVSDQLAAANVSPQNLSEEIVKQSVMTDAVYSSSSDSDFLSVDFMPELIDFSDDFFVSSLSGSETSQDHQIEYNGTYRPNTATVSAPLQAGPANANRKTPGSPMDLVSPAAVSSGISRSMSESLQTDDEENCDCTGTALRLLEEVASAPKPNEPQRTERELYFLKTAISEYAALFECTCLRHDSGLAMLLVTICEKLQLLFEEVSDSTGKHPELSHSKSQSSPGNGDRPYSGQDDTSLSRHRRDSRPRENLIMGHYHIDTPEEHFNVLSALVLLQLRRLAVLVSKLKRICEKREWNAHVSLLRAVMHRIKRLAATLQR